MNKHEEQFFFHYLEQTAEEMRHVETLRERVTIMVLTLASAIGGFIVQQKYSHETKPLAWFILILGLFGIMMVAKLYQIHQRLQKRLDYWYNYYDEICGPEAQILILRDKADADNKKEFEVLARIKHSYFWATIHFFVIVGGIFLLTIYDRPETSKKNSDKVRDSTNVTSKKPISPVVRDSSKINNSKKSN